MVKKELEERVCKVSKEEGDEDLPKEILGMYFHGTRELKKAMDKSCGGYKTYGKVDEEECTKLFLSKHR